MSKYTLRAKGKLKWYLGVVIDHDVKAGVSTMSQEQYIETLLDHFDMMDTKYYQQMIGGLMYESILTRPDIAFSVNQCVRFMSNPGPEHILAAKHILKYLKATKHLKLTYRRQKGNMGN
eukprot:3067510-Rhodomonas_salina.1